MSGDVEAAGDAVSGRYAEMRDKVHDAADQGRRTLHDRQDQAYAARPGGSQQGAVRWPTRPTQSMASISLEEQPILMAALGCRSRRRRQRGAAVVAPGEGAVGRRRGKLPSAPAVMRCSSAAGVLREEVAQADLGAKVSDLADKVVQGVTNGSSKS